jgi:tRNA-Thr(GGU) m(6)t(6)A37 methyltransferase TsaA
MEKDCEKMNDIGEVRFIGHVKSIGTLSEIEIFPDYCLGLDKLGDFSHVIILYWFHLRNDEKERGVLKVVPRRHLNAPRVGVFASRSPSRPNPIGLCVAKLDKIEGCILTVKGLDALEGSPILDIKPYLARGDAIQDSSAPEWTTHGPST